MDIQMIASFITSNLEWMILGLTGGIFLALIVFIQINIKLSKLTKRYRKLMAGSEGLNLERLLMTHIDEVHGVVKKVDHLEQVCQTIKEESLTNIKKVGIVRFNAFEDTGSDLSFAIAFLDEQSNGLVLSSIFGRSESRVYAKPIANGQSSYFLSDEEKAALAQAKNK
ncbi:hypothetical protein Ga0466249_004270 [Sporomusaceae bacterium BoRhaA]|uniref:DUF4446 family protein n=1 Tax=Pelorhabdus rhamnosifermentans TaxID=2772457 RepID=UPI001C05F349|nr:DUF4446 family protein [Pelorhabdus rhamnosifermentans]MBU2703134.1 hypothetical protein [Pelorhabdus rhamnosifermentans]